MQRGQAAESRPVPEALASCQAMVTISHQAQQVQAAPLWRATARRIAEVQRARASARRAPAQIARQRPSMR